MWAYFSDIKGDFYVKITGVMSTCLTCKEKSLENLTFIQSVIILYKRVK